MAGIYSDCSTRETNNYPHNGPLFQKIALKQTAVGRTRSSIVVDLSWPTFLTGAIEQQNAIGLVAQCELSGYVKLG